MLVLVGVSEAEDPIGPGGIRFNFGMGIKDDESQPLPNTSEDTQEPGGDGNAQPLARYTGARSCAQSCPDR